ncbi:MAG TPA: primosomal protein N' [Planctomycetota bacterium]
MAFMHLAEVAVVGPLRGTFTYGADAVIKQLVPGVRVLVPFGNRAETGFFLAERTLADVQRDGIDLRKLKAIVRVLDNPVISGGGTQALLPPTLLGLARWMARHYACPLGTTLAAMLPAGVKRGVEAERVRIVEAAVSAAELRTKAAELIAKKPKQAAVLLVLADISGPIAASDLLYEADASDSALNALAKAGLLRIDLQHPVDQSPAHGGVDAHAPEHDLVLNSEQQRALDAIENALRSGPPLPREGEGLGVKGHSASALSTHQLHGFLLHGVTGSGKTEVYLRALKTALAMGKQGLVLVPEIALTPQTAQRFERRLGRERVAVLHSHITDGERAEAWRAVRAGKIDIVVGARSALFAPLPRLGIIFIDEEHENAFKQETTPRYHARDVALELARASGAVLVLGSATPSFESLYLARTGKLQHLVLSQRVAGRPMPPVEIVDLTQENQETKRYTYLSRRLVAALRETLNRREQAILFMNRRGFATVITCQHCGQTEKCVQCDITLTSHRAPGSPLPREGEVAPASVPAVSAVRGQSDVLTCHYCGYRKPVPLVCSNCQRPGLKHWGLGTERIEEAVKKIFPEARVARMDSDTMTRRTAYLEALGNVQAGRTDILIGTQMIAKGLDFPNVTLVGVVLADTALHMPDFRSRERTFQLLAQVAGRAGRSEKGGRVIIQTHLPGDAAVRAAVNHDFETFALQELQERRAYNYPPYMRLARILIRGKDLPATKLAAAAVADALRQAAERASVPAAPEAGRDARPATIILGPAEAPLSRLEGFYRQHVLIKASSSEVLSELLGGPAAATIAKIKGADATIDVDPLGML